LKDLPGQSDENLSCLIIGKGMPNIRMTVHL
jgi:hypothetical protein